MADTPKFYEHDGNIWFGYDWDGTEEGKGDHQFLEVGDSYQAESYSKQLNDNPQVQTVALNGGTAHGAVPKKTKKKAKMKKEEEEEMFEDEETETEGGGGVMDTLKASTKTLAGGFGSGMKMAGIKSANDVAYDRLAHMLEKHMGMDGDKLQNPATKSVVLALLPLILHPMVTTFEDKLPYSDFIKSYCEIQMSITGMQFGGAAFGFVTDLVRDMKSAAEAGLPLPAQGSVDYRKMTVPELKGLCKSRHIDLPQRPLKDSLIDLLNGYDTDLEEKQVSKQKLVAG